MTNYILRELTTDEYDNIEYDVSSEHFRVIALGDGSITYGVDFELTKREKLDIALGILRYEIAKGKYFVEGFENMATFLTSLYFHQDQKIMTHLKSIQRKDGTFNLNKLKTVLYYMLFIEQKNEILCCVNRDRTEKVYEPFSGEYLYVNVDYDTHAVNFQSVAKQLTTTFAEQAETV